MRNILDGGSCIWKASSGPKTADSLKPLHPYLNWCEAEKRTSKIIKSPKYTNLNLKSPQKTINCLD